MRLRRNNLDPNIIEDELGNPMFVHLGIHPQDVDELLNTANGDGVYQKKIDQLESQIHELEVDVDYKKDIINELEVEIEALKHKVEYLQDLI